MAKGGSTVRSPDSREFELVPLEFPTVTLGWGRASKVYLTASLFVARDESTLEGGEIPECLSNGDPCLSSTAINILFTVTCVPLSLRNSSSAPRARTCYWDRVVHITCTPCRKLSNHDDNPCMRARNSRLHGQALSKERPRQQYRCPVTSMCRGSKSVLDSSTDKRVGSVESRLGLCLAIALAQHGTCARGKPIVCWTIAYTRAPAETPNCQGLEIFIQ
jgi:hypothetical protein